MSILLVIAALLALVCYGLVWARTVRDASSAAERPARVSGRFDLNSVVLVTGVVAHMVSLHAAISGLAGFRFGFGPGISAIFWVGVAILWFEGLSARIEALLSLVLPLAMVAALLPVLLPGVDFSDESGRPLFLPHLILGTLAYGVLLLAAVQAALMMAAERALHAPDRASPSVFARWFESLPPLLVLERILFRFIGIGFALLSLTVLSGVLFSEQVFGRPLRFDHKTVFSILSWLIFAVLLGGRVRYGWRGRTALRFTLAGFAVLVLAYLGSRFVLEVVLGRA